MASRADVEARLRGYAKEYDREFPSTTRIEGRIMARIATTPRDLRRAPSMRPKWTVAGVLVRQLAIVCVLLIFAGLLVVSVTRLRAVQQQNVPGGGPSGGVPGKADRYFSALHFVSANEGWIAESKASNSLAGPTVLYRTTDGGRSCSAGSPGTGRDPSRCVSAPTERRAWLSAEEGSRSSGRPTVARAGRG